MIAFLATRIGIGWRGSYLVPVYRFQGTAKLERGAGTHVWYALVSAAQQRVCTRGT